jgi:hypothetical protein
VIRVLLLLTALAGFASDAVAQDKLEPSDPIASIDGEPILLGELNLILVDRLRIRDLDKAPLDVQRAAAMILVRQHLALRTLRRQGGDALDAMINRQIETFATDAKRRGSSLEKYARQRKADQASVRADMMWRFAWAQYLKSRLNDQTLRSYYARHRDKYAGGRWEVSQIFVKMDSRDETSVGVAESRMNEIVAELRGASSLEPAFAAAAREHSDAGSSPDGGKIGWVEGDGDLPSIVMKAVRAAKIGELSGPIRSPLGLHLILVHQFDRKEVPFEQLTDLAQLRRDAADALFNLLLREQQDAKILWYIGELKPPANVSVIPK